MALSARPILCQLKSSRKPPVQRDEPAAPAPAAISSLSVQKARLTETAADNGKIVLQPRLCTLRSYGSDRDRMGVVRMTNTVNGNDGTGDQVSQFFETLSEYIESSKKSQDFEIISGRLAMIVFAGTVAMESVTGNSLFRKMDLPGILEAGGVCLGAVAAAAAFAWLSSARSRVDRIFSVGCNTFIDSLIDQIVDGLFYETDLSDWSDDL